MQLSLYIMKLWESCNYLLFFYSVVEQASIREISISRYAQLHILTSMDWEICILLISMWGKPPPGTSSKSSSYRSKRSVASMPTLIVPWMKTDTMMSKINIRTNSVTLNVQGFFIFLGPVQIHLIIYVCTERTQNVLHWWHIFFQADPEVSIRFVLFCSS